MARPSPSIRSVDAQTVQTATGIRLKSVHDFLGTHVRIYDHMNVIGSHLYRPDTPPAVQADLAERIEHRHTAVSVKKTGRLLHLLAHRGDSLRISFRQSVTGNIMAPVYRAGFVAVQVRSIASESNEGPHSECAVTAPLQSRLRDLNSV